MRACWKRYLWFCYIVVRGEGCAPEITMNAAWRDSMSPSVILCFVGLYGTKHRRRAFHDASFVRFERAHTGDIVKGYGCELTDATPVHGEGECPEGDHCLPSPRDSTNSQKYAFWVVTPDLVAPLCTYSSMCRTHVVNNKQASTKA